MLFCQEHVSGELGELLWLHRGLMSLDHHTNIGGELV